MENGFNRDKNGLRGDFDFGDSDRSTSDFAQHFGWTKDYEQDVHDVVRDILRDVDRQSSRMHGSDSSAVSSQSGQGRYTAPNRLQELIQEVYGDLSPMLTPFPTEEDLLSTQEVLESDDLFSMKPVAESVAESVSEQIAESVAEPVLNPVSEQIAESVTELDKKPESKPIEASLPAPSLVSTPKKVRPWLRRGELLGGMVLGLVVATVCWVAQAPLAQKFLTQAEKSGFEQVVSRTVQSDWTRQNLVFEEVECSSPSNARLNLSVDRLEAELSPKSFVGRSLYVNRVAMRGVSFPLLTPDRKMATGTGLEADADVAAKVENLHSLAYLEGIRERRIPQYSKLCDQLRAIQSEMETIQTRLHTDKGMTEATPADVERLVQLHRDAEALKKDWTDVNASVTEELGGIHAEIEKDGQEVSECLQKWVPDEAQLAETLYLGPIRSKLAQILAWSDALTRMAQTGSLAQGNAMVERLETSGTLELDGQTLPFDGEWNLDSQASDSPSFFGILRFPTKPDAQITLSYKQKNGFVQRNITVTLPLGKETLRFGSDPETTLVADSQDGHLRLDWTLLDQEMKGTVTLVRNQLTFQNVESTENPTRATLQKKWTELPQKTWEVHVTLAGTLDNPNWTFTSPNGWTQELLPVFVQAAEEQCKARRMEAVTQIYEKLKNAETAFNSDVEPLYRAMFACTETLEKVYQNTMPHDALQKEQRKLQIQRELNQEIAAAKSPAPAPAQSPKQPKDVAETPITPETSEPMPEIPELAETLEISVSPASQEDDEWEVPYFNPNIGVLDDSVAPQVGNSAENVPQTKNVPVRKVDILATMETEAEAEAKVETKAEVKAETKAETENATSTPSIASFLPVDAKPSEKPSVNPSENSLPDELFHTASSAALPKPMTAGVVRQDTAPTGAQESLPSHTEITLPTLEKEKATTPPAKSSSSPSAAPNRDKKGSVPVPMMRSTRSFGS